MLKGEGDVMRAGQGPKGENGKRRYGKSLRQVKMGKAPPAASAVAARIIAAMRNTSCPHRMIPKFQLARAPDWAAYVSKDEPARQPGEGARRAGSKRMLRMDFLILVFGLALLVWAIVLLRQGGLLAGSLVVLAAGICLGHPFFNVSVGPLPITVDRILLGGLFALTLACRACGWIGPIRWTRADFALAGLFAVLAASTLTHDWHLFKSQPLANLLFLYGLPLVMYWIVRQVPVSERAITGMFVAVAIFGVYLAVTAIAETHQLWFLVWPRYIASPEFVEFLGRGRGPLLNPAGAGILQGLCLSATLLLWPRLNRRGQFVLLALLPLLAWGIYCTLTRSAWLGAGLGMLVIVGLALPRPGACPSWRVACWWRFRRRLCCGITCWSSNATSRSVPKRRPSRPACDRFWPPWPGTCFATGRCWAAVSASTGRKPAILVRSLDRSATGKSPAVRAAQRAVGPVGRDRPGRHGPVCHGARAVAACGLAAVARARGAARLSSVRALVSGIRRRLVSQRDVSRRVDHPDDQHVAVVPGRVDAERRLVAGPELWPCPCPLCTPPACEHTQHDHGVRRTRACRARRGRGRCEPAHDARRRPLGRRVRDRLAAHAAFGRFRPGDGDRPVRGAVFHGRGRLSHLGRPRPPATAERPPIRRGRLLRIYVPFLAWSGVYLAFKAVKVRLLPRPAERFPGIEVLWLGSFFHLWFMPFILATTLAVFLVGRTIVGRPVRAKRLLDAVLWPGGSSPGCRPIARARAWVLSSWRSTPCRLRSGALPWRLPGKRARRHCSGGRRQECWPSRSPWLSWR